MNKQGYLDDVVLESYSKFGKYVVQQMRTRLTKAGKRSSNELYNSTRYEIDKKNLSVSVLANGYADFINQGVRGKKESRKAPFSKYRFGTGNFSGSGNEFKRRIDAWIARKNLFLRDEDGKFKKGGRKTLSFLIRRSIYNKGIAPTPFIDEPVERGLIRLENDLTEHLGEEIVKNIEFNLNGTTK